MKCYTHQRVRTSPLYDASNYRRCLSRGRSAQFTPRATAAPAASTEESVLLEAKKRIVEDEAKYIVNTYGRPGDIVVTHGKGALMYDITGKEYLDFAAGIAVNCLGHAHPDWLEAVTEQAGKVAHTSNLFHTQPQVDLAKRLVQSSFADKVFFCNSGTEANEGAIKFSRKWAKVNAGLDPYDPKAEGPFELVSFKNCFHGRTLGALTLTYKDQYKTPFQPLIPGHHMVDFLDLEAAKKVIKKGRTAAVFVEPIQGEGGINSASKAFLKGLRKACDEAGALLVFDEVQCGLGRTGKLWGYEHYGVEPDIMTVAKPLAGGMPIGAVLMKESVAAVMAPGDHGSTFAGNPLVCHAGTVVFDIVANPEFLSEIRRKGEKLRQDLKKAIGSNPHVEDIRGLGLINGIQLDQAAGPVVKAARDAGVIVITAGKGDIVRLVPPLVVTDKQIDRLVSTLSEAIKALD